MENQNKESRSYLNYGVVIGIVMIAIFVLYYVFNLYTSSKLGLIPTFIFAILIIFTQIKYARSVDGNITYGNLFAAGFKATCAATAIYLVFLILFLWLVPDYKTNFLEFQRQGMIAKGMTDAQVDTGMSFMEKSFSVIAIGGGLLGNLLVGLIASLVGAAIAKKNPRPQLDQL